MFWTQVLLTSNRLLFYWFSCFGMTSLN